MSKRVHDLAAATTGLPAVPVPLPRRRWVTRSVVPTVMLASAGGLLAYAARGALLPAVDVRAVSIVAKEGVVSLADETSPSEPPRFATTTSIVQAPGWIEPDPFAVNVSALHDGVIREVLVLEGARVEAEQVVARMIDDDTRIALQRAEAILAAKVAAHAVAMSVVRTAEAAVAVEEAAAAEIRDEVESNRPLSENGTIAIGPFRRLGIRLQVQEARVVVARAAVSEAQADVVRCEADMQIATSEVQQARMAHNRMEIRSPIAGVVLARLAEPGTRMMTSGQDASPAVVLRLYDPQRLQVRVDIPLADAAKVGMDYPAIITTEALPGVEFTGRVTRIVQEANVQKNTVQVKVAIDNPDATLRPEMLTRVKFHRPFSNAALSTVKQPDGRGYSGAGPSQRLFAPVAALFDVADATAQTWVVDEAGSRVSLKQVQLGSGEEAGWREISSGLSMGDRVIVDPPPSLNESVRVRIMDEGGAS